MVQADIRRLPFGDASFDVAVLDPPYVHNSGHANPHDYGATTVRYNGHATTQTMYNADIMDLYYEGMAEAYRVLDPDGGQLWVKCKDEVEREVQRWSHIRIYEMAQALGFAARDLFVLAGTTAPQRWPGRVQRHARKNHSFLWIFVKPDERYKKLLARPAPRGLTTPRTGVTVNNVTGKPPG
jgi:DNA modification methylase